MLTIKLIQEQTDLVAERLRIKNFEATSLLNEILQLDDLRRSIQSRMDNQLAELNSLSKQIGQFYREGKTSEAEAAKEKTAEFKEQGRILKEQLTQTENQIQELLVQLPNLPHELVPAGKTADDNLLIRSGGIIPTADPERKAHWDLLQSSKLIDFELGNKLTGAGFPVYKKEAARLQRALINFFLDQGIKAGYTEVQPPILVNQDSAYGTGQLPDKEGQMYHAEADGLYLIPTAEVPVTNIFRDEILEAADLPLRYIAYTPCFRREAGSWGSHVRGLNRLHQFDKVEIVQVRHPQNSYQGLDEMVNYVESLVSLLNLPYRIIRLCGGDMSFTSAMTYDFEVWAAGQGRWLEVSSVSNFESFQANRLKLRFKEKGDKRTTLAHTLNGSALALPRIVAAILENNQKGNEIMIPEILHPYTGFDRISL
ncbi:MAG: serine--tRNA ligase [Bacteroidales bacterium]|nr:serine--tRNA ligase [Bacteroidales bacterium]MDD3385487.1 serine--tRNA ligase [Bacteroidales bacterium]MDD3811721.1 serine--tRNA ligase [Bacteroidales bacterium]MDD4813348.1 serine--tRNA ligase [Bacteroidales bacterium]